MAYDDPPRQIIRDALARALFDADQRIFDALGATPFSGGLVRSDGAALEVKIQGSVYGEDGKVGMRGRLVTKQGQMLANALLAELKPAEALDMAIL